MSALLLSYPGNEDLGARLCATLPAQRVEFEMREFPDRETYLRIRSEVAGNSVAVLCTLKDPDARFLPLAYMSDLLREMGANRVGLIAPYLAYMRQDKRFHDGEALTSASFARLLSAQFDWLVTVDPHLHRRESLSEIYTIPTAVVRAAPLLSDWIRTHVRQPLIIGPDAESEQWVSEVARGVPAPFVILGKVRQGDRDVLVSAVPDIRQWSAHTAVLVDDIISSAATMSATVRQWREAGLAAPVCVGVHGVFGEQACEILSQAGAAQIVTTNSIPHPTNGIELSGALAGPIRKLSG